MQRVHNRIGNSVDPNKVIQTIKYVMLVDVTYGEPGPAWNPRTLCRQVCIHGRYKQYRSNIQMSPYTYITLSPRLFCFRSHRQRVWCAVLRRARSASKASSAIRDMVANSVSTRAARYATSAFHCHWALCVHWRRRVILLVIADIDWKQRHFGLAHCPGSLVGLFGL